MSDVQIRFRAESSGARREINALEREIQELRRGMGYVRRTAAEAAQGVDRLGDEAKEAAIATQLWTAAQVAVTAAIRNAEDAFRDSAIRHGEYVAAAARVRENIEALSEGQAVLNDFWRIASGQIEDYTESIQTTIPSVVNLTEAEDALTAAIDAHLRALQAATGDPLSDYIDTLTLTSEAADTAFGSINRIGEAVRDADFRRAEAELRDFDDAFRRSEATIPRVRSEMERFTGTLPDASRSIQDTTIELRNLSQEAQAAARDAEFLNASFSAIDAFDPRAPGRNARSFDTAGFALRTGEELASQAIRTAGELRRIEQERVESLADLERAYSEKIVAINERKREQLAAIEQEIETERLRRLASIQEAFAEAATAEVAAREAAAERIQQIEERAAEQRLRLREQLNERLIALEQRRDARIQDLTAGFIEREQARQQEILAITERAADARAEAEQRYADRVQEINNRLVEQVRDIQLGLQADIESLEAGFAQRQADRADEIVRVTQEAADARAAANETFTDTMQGVYNDLVSAWDDLEEGFTERQAGRAAERIEIEQNAAAARAAAYQDYTGTVARISTDLVEEVRGIQAEITEVIADAAAARVEIEQNAIDARAEANAEYAERIEAIEADRVQANAAYAKTLARISTDLVDEVRDVQDKITRIIEDAAAKRIEIELDAIEQRREANAAYSQTLEDIEANREHRVLEQQRRMTEIQAESAAARLSADERYADRFQDIQNDLVDRVVDIQRDLNDTLNDLRDAQLDAEQDRLDSLVDLHKETQQKLEDLERNRTQTVEDLRRKFQQDQLDAATQLDRDLQDAEGDPAAEAAARQRFNRRIEDLTREFHRRQIDLQISQRREREAIARQTAAREVEIAERAQAQLAGIEQREAAARAQAQEGITAAESEAGVSFTEAQANYVPALSAHEEALRAHAAALNSLAATEASDIEDINQRISEIIETAFRDAATAAETLAATLAAVNSETEQSLTALDSQTAGTVAGLNQQITDAETRTGLSFEDALVNYRPAVDLNTQALQALTGALDSISAEEVSAGQTLREALSAVTSAEQERLAALDTQTAGTVGDLNQQITDAQTRAGLSFEQALVNYTPALDLNTQALNTLNERLARIRADEGTGLARVSASERADRASTTASQQALETRAGVSLEDARENFVPALSHAAQATLTLNETMQALDTSFREAIAEIQDAGRVDRQSVDDAIQTAIAEAFAQQTALETQAGTTFADASDAFQPGLSDIGQAGFDRDASLTGIDQTESEGIDAVNAQSIADRLETDAAITETRDTYIKARDTEIFKHNVAMLQLNTAEAADIKAIRETLSQDLQSIDEKLDLELAEIRDQKLVFDARMTELIEAINAEGNLSFEALKEDTAAMRSSLETIAESLRDDAWKGALLKIANVGITVAGVAAGTAVGAPQVGLAVGQAVGGLVEQGGNELFHFPQTDRIARSIARQEALRRSRETPAYLPDANQIRNSKDLSREIVRGVSEGLAIGERRDGGFGGASQQASLPEEITATLVLEWPDGATIELADQILRLRASDRTNL